MKFTSSVLLYAAAALLAIDNFAFADTEGNTKPFSDVTKNDETAAHAIVQEDSIYWSRFLADPTYSLPPPTKPPKCLIDVSGID
jgi:hypothetical protein